MKAISNEQWLHFQEHGYVKLGSVLRETELRALQEESDSIMLGTSGVNYGNLRMELDTTGHGDDVRAGFSKGFKGATLDYKRIQDLEYHPLFLAYAQKQVFRRVCSKVYGSSTSISVFRAMLINKPPYGGARLKWHQDCWNYLDQQPILTIWTALDSATTGNGCLQIIPGSHKRGQINSDDVSGFLKDEMILQHCPEEAVVYLRVEPGEVLLLHNLLLHASDPNRGTERRRAFSVCYMDASTRNLNTSYTYPVVFGENALSPRSLRAQSRKRRT